MAAKKRRKRSDSVKKQMISWKQAFVLVFISYMLVALTYIPSAESDAKNVDKLVSISIAMCLVLLSLLPVYFLSGRKSGCNIIDCVRDCAKPLTKPVALFYVLAFSYTIVITTSRFSLFITSVLLVESKTTIFIIIILAAACYAAVLGIEAVARASLFVFAVLIFSMLFSCVILVKDVDFLNLRPLFYNGASDIFSEAILDASKLIEAAVLGMLAPKIVGGIKKTIITFTLLFWVAVMLLTFLIISVLGEYSSVQLFPVYTLVSLARIGNFHRFDAILSGIWIAGDFIKVAVLLIVSGECMKYVVSGRRYRVCMVLTVIVIFAFSMLASFSFERYIAISNYVVIGAVTVAASVVIPLVLLVTDTLKKMRCRKCKKQNAL